MVFLEIFETIILSSLVGSIIVLLILSINKVFKYKLSPAFQYYIWLILIIKLINPFGLESSLNFSDIYQSIYRESNIHEYSTHVEITNNQNTDLEDKKSISSCQNSNDNNQPYKTYSLFKNKLYIEKIFFLLWISGCLSLIILFILSYKKLRNIFEASHDEVISEHKEILNDCMKKMHIRSKVKLLYSSQISSPCLCGIIKPKILIPINIAENINIEDLKCIFMHELTHLKRKDVLINWIVLLLSIVYWFNPIVVYGLNKMKKDCELSCDNNVLSYLDENKNIQYGNVLIKVLSECRYNNKLIASTSMVMNSSEIKRRVIMISKYKKRNFKGILFGLVIVAIVGSVAVKINASKLNINNLYNAQAAAHEAKVIKSKSGKSTNSKIPFSSDIVIYNSHAAEDYKSGMKVTDIGALINNKLVKDGLKSNFIKCPVSKEYKDSYKNSRKIITDNVKNYSNTVLIDIHRDAVSDMKSDTRKIIFIIAKNNPHYEENKKIAEQMARSINKSSQVKAEIMSYNRGKMCFNQDLSKNSILVNLGNNMSSDKDIKCCANALVSAIEKNQKTN